MPARINPSEGGSIPTEMIRQVCSSTALLGSGYWMINIIQTAENDTAPSDFGREMGWAVLMVAISGWMICFALGFYARKVSGLLISMVALILIASAEHQPEWAFSTNRTPIAGLLHYWYIAALVLLCLATLFDGAPPGSLPSDASGGEADPSDRRSNS